MIDNGTFGADNFQEHLSWTGGAQPPVARACAPVCPSLATPLVLPLRFSSLTEKITIFSCGVKLQEVLSGLEKKHIGHTRALFSTLLSLLFFFPLHLGCNFSFCITVYELPFFADDGKYVAALFFKPVLKVM